MDSASALTLFESIAKSGELAQVYLNLPRKVPIYLHICSRCQSVNWLLTDLYKLSQVILVMSNGPPPSRLVSVSTLPLCEIGDKVRFLGW